MARPSVLTFDVYGTLAQWDETVLAALTAVMAEHGRADADAKLAADTFDAVSRRLQTLGAFRSYADILSDSLRPALATAGLSPTAADAERVLAALACVPPFPEVPEVLRKLAREHRLAPISNTDDALLRATLDGLDTPFATTVTAEQAKAYKPNPGLFRYALGKLGVEPADLLHVAQGTFSDLAVCASLGLRVVWVNRAGAELQEGLKPIAVIDDLSTLPEVIASL